MSSYITDLYNKASPYIKSTVSNLDQKLEIANTARINTLNYLKTNLPAHITNIPNEITKKVSETIGTKTFNEIGISGPVVVLAGLGSLSGILATKKRFIFLAPLPLTAAFLLTNSKQQIGILAGSCAATIVTRLFLSCCNRKK